MFASFVALWKCTSTARDVSCRRPPAPAFGAQSCELVPPAPAASPGGPSAPTRGKRSEYSTIESRRPPRRRRLPHADTRLRFTAGLGDESNRSNLAFSRAFTSENLFLRPLASVARDEIKTHSQRKQKCVSGVGARGGRRPAPSCRADLHLSIIAR
ncbi:hypothetical protein EVAR_23819_1 [Eumeta japonica]|uniref:Uncharacterized protein n=1 Tax=Eumeta variegata TaxID=151549 RepID=A0A4C1VK37_EUMVA|nr:hypothetical protein EVAR_23819_1 [Eumeta japonica]